MSAEAKLSPVVESRDSSERASVASFKLHPSQLSGAVLEGRYEIHGFLSHGATSRVYLAEDLERGTPVVIKMLTPEAAQNPELRACMEREVHVGATIHHPNVVHMLGTGETAGGLPYVVLEALLGEPLDDVLRRQGTLPGDLALILARQAASALVATHRAGVIHRDVKPGNLLVLGAPDQPYALKLLDYGMARVEGAKDHETPHVVGTVEYMAPEQIVVEEVDCRTDIYSFGVVLFRLFTGHLPFETSAGPMVLRHQLFSPVPPPSWLDERIDARLEAVILNCTRKHPDNRYPSMDAVIEDLEAILGLSNKEVSVRPLQHDPDLYEPRTERGREAFEVLAKKFGAYASVRPSAP